MNDTMVKLPRPVLRDLRKLLQRNLKKLTKQESKGRLLGPKKEAKKQLIALVLPEINSALIPPE